MTSIFQRLPVAGLGDVVDRVDARARDLNLFKLLIGLVTLPFMAIGILAWGLWLLLTWAFAAVLVGWDLGQETTRTLRPQPRRRGG